MGSAWAVVVGSIGGVCLGGFVTYALDRARWQHEGEVRWLRDKRSVYLRFIQSADEFQASYDFLFDAVARERRGEEVPDDPAEAIDRYLTATATHAGLIRELSLLAGPEVRHASARAWDAMIDLTSERIKRAMNPETAGDVLAQPSPALDEFHAAIQAFEDAARRELGIVVQSGVRAAEHTGVIG
jgi:hypothetical protein